MADAVERAAGKGPIRWQKPRLPWRSEVANACCARFGSAGASRHCSVSAMAGYETCRNTGRRGESGMPLCIRALLAVGPDGIYIRGMVSGRLQVKMRS